MRKGHRLLLFRESEVECSIQMHFDQADASNTASIQKFPLLNELRLLFHGKLPLECPQHTPERLGLRIDGGIVPRKVNSDTPAGKLCVDFPKGTKLVGADKEVAYPGEIFKILEMIKLILEMTPAGGLRQMMGFIHNEGEGSALEQRRFHCFPQLAFPDSGNFAIYKGVLESS